MFLFIHLFFLLYIYIYIYIYIHTYVVQNVLGLPQKKPEKQDSFYLYFNIDPLVTSVLNPTMLKHYNPITEENGIMVI